MYTFEEKTLSKPKVCGYSLKGIIAFSYPVFGGNYFSICTEDESKKQEPYSLYVGNMNLENFQELQRRKQYLDEIKIVEVFKENGEPLNYCLIIEEGIDNQWYSEGINDFDKKELENVDKLFDLLKDKNCIRKHISEKYYDLDTDKGLIEAIKEKAHYDFKRFNLEENSINVSFMNVGVKFEDQNNDYEVFNKILSELSHDRRPQKNFLILDIFKRFYLYNESSVISNRTNYFSSMFEDLFGIIETVYSEEINEQGIKIVKGFNIKLFDLPRTKEELKKMFKEHKRWVKFQKEIENLTMQGKRDLFDSHKRKEKDSKVICGDDTIKEHLNNLYCQYHNKKTEYSEDINMWFKIIKDLPLKDRTINYKGDKITFTYNDNYKVKNSSDFVITIETEYRKYHALIGKYHINQVIQEPIETIYNFKKI